MVEYLDYLLSSHHLLNVAVQLAQAGLLAAKVVFAAAAAVLNVEKHGSIAYHDHQGQPPVEQEQQQQSAHHLDEALNDHSKAVVQRIGHRVHIIGEQAHQIAFALAVKKVQRQLLQMAVQVPADVVEHLLGGPYHDLGVAQGGQGTSTVDSCCHCHP